MDIALEDLNVGSSILAVSHDHRVKVWTRVSEDDWQMVGNPHHFGIDEVEGWVYSWVRLVQVGPLNMPGEDYRVDKEENE